MKKMLIASMLFAGVMHVNGMNNMAENSENQYSYFDRLNDNDKEILCGFIEEKCDFYDDESSIWQYKISDFKNDVAREWIIHKKFSGDCTDFKGFINGLFPHQDSFSQDEIEAEMYPYEELTTIMECEKEDIALFVQSVSKNDGVRYSFEESSDLNECLIKNFQKYKDASHGGSFSDYKVCLFGLNKEITARDLERNVPGINRCTVKSIEGKKAQKRNLLAKKMSKEIERRKSIKKFKESAKRWGKWTFEKIINAIILDLKNRRNPPIIF